MDGAGSANLVAVYSVTYPTDKGPQTNTYMIKDDAAAFQKSTDNAVMTPGLGYTVWDPNATSASTVFVCTATEQPVSGSQKYVIY